MGQRVSDSSKGKGKGQYNAPYRIKTVSGTRASALTRAITVLSRSGFETGRTNERRTRDKHKKKKRQRNETDLTHIFSIGLLQQAAVCQTQVERGRFSSRKRITRVKGRNTSTGNAAGFDTKMTL
jgi:hypothetical protein